MDVLKFIGGRRSKCIFLNLKIEKNAFRLHEEQNLNGTNDNFGDSETGVLRVYGKYIYHELNPSESIPIHKGVLSSPLRPLDAWTLVLLRCAAAHLGPDFLHDFILR
jgi:hypothetical protein